MSALQTDLGFMAGGLWSVVRAWGLYTGEGLLEKKKQRGRVASKEILQQLQKSVTQTLDPNPSVMLRGIRLIRFMIWGIVHASCRPLMCI